MGTQHEMLHRGRPHSESKVTLYKSLSDNLRFDLSRNAAISYAHFYTIKTANF